MEIIIRGNPKEIAALVVETKERQKPCSVVLKADERRVAETAFKVIRDMQSKEVQGQPVARPIVFRLSETKLGSLLREGLKRQPAQEPEASTESKTEQKDES